MTPFPELVVTLAVGERRRSFPGDDLERLLPSPGLRLRLIALLFGPLASDPAPALEPDLEPTAAPGPEPNHPQLVHGEAGGRGEERLPGSLETPTKKNFSGVGVRGGEGCRGEAGARWGQPVDDAERTARYLADRLDDPKSLRWYRLVTTTLGASTVRDALVRALEVPRGEVRRSRAALFTALVRPLVAARLRLRSAR